MAITDNDQRGPEQRRDRDAKNLKPSQPNAPDEIGGIEDVEDNPMLVREEVKNTSDSSGLHSNDDAAGEKIKEQLRKGHQQVSRMD